MTPASSLVERLKELEAKSAQGAHDVIINSAIRDLLPQILEALERVNEMEKRDAA